MKTKKNQHKISSQLGYIPFSLSKWFLTLWLRYSFLPVTLSNFLIKTLQKNVLFWKSKTFNAAILGYVSFPRVPQFRMSHLSANDPPRSSDHVGKPLILWCRCSGWSTIFENARSWANKRKTDCNAKVPMKLEGSCVKSIYSVNSDEPRGLHSVCPRSINV